MILDYRCVISIFVILKLQRFSLSPGALSKNFVQVQSHGFLIDQIFNFAFKFSWENPHQSFGSKPVFGSLLVITLRHIFEEIVAGQVNIVNDLAKLLGECLSPIEVYLCPPRRWSLGWHDRPSRP